MTLTRVVLTQSLSQTRASPSHRLPFRYFPIPIDGDHTPQPIRRSPHLKFLLRHSSTSGWALWGRSTIRLGRSTIRLGRSTIGLGRSTIGLGRSTIRLGRSTIRLGRSTIGLRGRCTLLS